MTEGRLAVVAVGGNSLITSNAQRSVPDQFDAAAVSMRYVADMVQAGWRVVLTHGNGPQVGFILRRSELALHELHPVPMDYAVADTQGAIGYMFQKALLNEFSARGMQRSVATVVTQVRVDEDDAAFSDPAKPIGSFMDEATARKREAELGWRVKEDAGRGWRWVVPSPMPREIIELDSIRALCTSGCLVVACGGGGIPVVRRSGGKLRGVEAVIDKDHVSALLAEQLGADLFLISTAVPQVMINFNKPNERALARVTLAEVRELNAQGHFAKGSMQPKIVAMMRFLEGGGAAGLITDPENIGRALDGETGTHFVSG